MNKRRISLLILTGLFIPEILSSQAEPAWQEKMQSLPKLNIDSFMTKKLSDSKAADGLKEALRVGIGNTVKSIGKADGFFKNGQIKIKFPEEFKFLEQGLRTMGQDKKIDDFIVSMNRAAEDSVPLAQKIFLDTMAAMNWQDVQGILHGSDTAATAYFKGKTYDQLKKTFAPVVKKTLIENRVGQQYKDIQQVYKRIPFAQKLPLTGIDDYVMTKALDGIFLVLGQEETRIRKDPNARVTDLLREVF